MSGHRFDPRRIRLHRSYTVDEIARALGVHKNTVRGWQRKGLETIDQRRPALFDGRSVRSFLAQQRSGRRRPCPPGMFYCFRCREPRSPALGMVDYVPFSQTTGNLRAMCASCGTMMHRRARHDRVSGTIHGIEVHVTEAQPRLKGREEPSLYCDLEKA